MAFIEEEAIEEIIKKIQKGSFTILDFMGKFNDLFPEKWEKLVKKYSQYGSKKRYTSVTYLSNRLYSYSQKPDSILRPFKKYRKGGKGDYRKPTEEEKIFWKSMDSSSQETKLI